MINLIKKLKNKKNNENSNQETKNRLQKELRKVCNELEKTNLWFQNEVDSNLIDACIHQRKVLNAKYKYLINKIKISQF